MLLKLFLVVGIVFGALAGAIAFLITYQEYRKHRYEGWKLWQPAISAGGFAFWIFFFLSLTLGAVLKYIV